MEETWTREIKVCGERFELLFVRRPFREGLEVRVNVRGKEISLAELGLDVDLLEPLGDPARTIERIAVEGGFDTIVIGSGPDEAALRRHADSLGIARRVTFLGRVPYAVVQVQLEEGPRLLPGNSQDRAVGEGGAGHRL